MISVVHFSSNFTSVFYKKVSWNLLVLWQYSMPRKKKRLDTSNTHSYWQKFIVSHINCESNPCLPIINVACKYLRCCYSFNMLPHSVRGGAWFISAKLIISEFQKFFPGTNLVSINYVRYCRLIPIRRIRWWFSFFFSFRLEIPFFG